LNFRLLPGLPTHHGVFISPFQIEGKVLLDRCVTQIPTY
jgi:hypothetical protein